MNTSHLSTVEQSSVTAVRPVNCEMLTLARESRGWTQSKLSEETGIPQGNLSKYEAGLLTVKDEHLPLIAEALHYPLSFFYQDSTMRGCNMCIYHRRRSSLPMQELKKIQADVNRTRIQAEYLLRQVKIHGDNQFQWMDIQDFKSPEEVARFVRKSWNLPMGPVQNVIGVIEGAGGLVFRRSYGPKIDACSQWVTPLPPMFYVNENTPTDRARFTLCHEIGHVVMHRLASEDDMEREADRFASEFLMPAEEIANDLSNLTLQRLGALKQYWKVSMQSLLYRARTLGKISPDEYLTWVKKLSSLGYRKHEPIELPPEEPAILTSLLQYHRTKLSLTDDEISSLLRLHKDEFQSLYGQEAHSQEARGLQLV